MKIYKRKTKRILAAALVLCNLLVLTPFAFASDALIIPYDINFKSLSIPTEFYNKEFSGVDYSFEPLPSADNPSLCLKPQAGGYQAYLDIDINPSEKMVVEASVMFTGTQSSVQRIFTVSGTGGANVLGTRNKNGTFALADNSQLKGIVKDQFNDIAYIIDCTDRTYDVMLNGKTVVEGCKFSNAAQETVSRVRIQVSSINASGELDEKIYLNYLRVYNTDRVLNEEEFAKAQASVRTYEQPKDERDETVTEEMISEAMAGNVLFYMDKPRACIGDDVVQIDEENSAITPFLLGGTTMIPLRFLAESLGAQVVYDDENSKATVTLDGNTVCFTQGEKEFTVNGENKLLPEAPYTKDGRIFIPLRGISEALGKKVFWNDVGYVLVGDNADEFDITDFKDRKILFESAIKLAFDFPSKKTVAEDFKKNSSGVHPRIILTSDRLEELKEEIKTDEQQKYWYEQLLVRCDNFVKTDPVKYGRLDGIRMLATSREVLNRVPDLALGYLLSGKAEYKDRAVEELINVCTFPDWNPHHFLDVAEMCMAVSMGYDWLYHELSGEQRATIEKAIKEFAIDEILRDFNNEPITAGRRSWTWWSDESPSYPQNWVSVCCGGIGSGALAVMDLYPEEASDVISHTFRHLADLIFLHAPDGTSEEGIHYWNYIIEFFAYYSSSLTLTCGTDYGLLDAPSAKKFAYFCEDLKGPAGKMSFDVCRQHEYPNTKGLVWHAQKFNDPNLLNAYLKDIKGTVYEGGSAESMIWYKPEFYNPDYDTAKTERYMSVYGAVTMRTGGDSKSEMMLGFLGGGSTHQDVGSFILDAVGERWSRDPGREEAMYTGGTDRVGYFRNRTEGHSTLTINPNLGLSQNPYVTATMETVQSDDSQRFAILDMSKNYEFLGTKSVRRGIMLERDRQYVIVRDEVTAAEPMDFYWFMQTGAEIEISEDGKSAVLSSNGKKLSAQILTDGDFKFSVLDAEPLPVSPYKADATVETGYRRLTIHTEHLSEVNLTVGLTPLYGTETIPGYTPEVLPLDEWKLSGDNVEKPVLNGISINGEMIEGFSPDNFNYTTDIRQDAPVPVISAACDENSNISIVQPEKVNLTSKITVSDKEHPHICSVYYINFNVIPVGTGEPTFPAEKLTVKSLSAGHIPQPQNSPENVIDGDFSTRWSSDKIGTEIDFDLGSKKDINYVAMALSGGESRKTKFEIYSSDDKKEWTLLYSGWSPGNTSQLVLYDVGDTKARYMRIVGYGNNNDTKWFSPTEINFWKRLEEEK